MHSENRIVLNSTAKLKYKGASNQTAPLRFLRCFVVFHLASLSHVFWGSGASTHAHQVKYLELPQNDNLAQIAQFSCFGVVCFC